MRQRPSARLLIVDPQGCVLLLRLAYRDGPIEGASFWLTPGGRLEPGETHEQAALRELWEEVGLRRASLGEPVARRVVIFRQPDGELAEVNEWHFRVDLPDRRLGEPTLTDEERGVIAGHRWWSPAELAATSETVWPEGLLSLLREPRPPAVIAPASAGFSRQAAACDFSFHVNSELLPPFDGPGLGSVGWVRPYRKTLPLAATDYEAWIGDPSRAVFAAARDDRLVGFLAVAPHWNGYALIHELAVDLSARQRGVARRLMDQAVAWARSRKLAGLTLETQSNNVPACRFYSRYGFELGGHDRWLYRALDPTTREVALFWYLSF